MPYDMKRQVGASALLPSGRIEYKGLLLPGNGKRGFGFVEKSSVARIDGALMEIVVLGDLQLHVRNNRALGDPLPKNVWIRFFINPCNQNNDGIEAVHALLLQQIRT